MGHQQDTDLTIADDQQVNIHSESDTLPKQPLWRTTHQFLKKIPPVEYGCVVSIVGYGVHYCGEETMQQHPIFRYAKSPGCSALISNSASAEAKKKARVTFDEMSTQLAEIARKRAERTVTFDF